MQCYAVTDRSLLAANPGGVAAALCLQTEQWIAAGVEWVQLRERDLAAGELLTLVDRLAALAHAGSSRTKLLVNGLPPEIAAAHGAHGVHLRGGATVDAVRDAAAAAGYVSVSCHSFDELHAARAGGAALALWAPVFTKVVAGEEVAAGTGLPALRAACREARPMPVFALGGVSARNAAACMEAGAAGIAGIRLFHEEGWRALRDRTFFL